MTLPFPLPISLTHSLTRYLLTVLLNPLALLCISVPFLLHGNVGLIFETGCYLFGSLFIFYILFILQESIESLLHIAHYYNQ